MFKLCMTLVAVAQATTIDFIDGKRMEDALKSIEKAARELKKSEHDGGKAALTSILKHAKWKALNKQYKQYQIIKHLVNRVKTEIDAVDAGDKCDGYAFSRCVVKKDADTNLDLLNNDYSFVKLLEKYPDCRKKANCHVPKNYDSADIQTKVNETR